MLRGGIRHFVREGFKLCIGGGDSCNPGGRKSNLGAAELKCVGESSRGPKSREKNREGRSQDHEETRGRKKSSCGFSGMGTMRRGERKQLSEEKKRD